MGIEYKAIVLRYGKGDTNLDLFQEYITEILNKNNQGGWKFMQIATVDGKPIAIFSKLDE